MSSANGMTAGEALGLLGLSSPASPEAVKAAFKAAVKAARPDQGDGDPELFRRVIEAYRLLQRLQTARAALTGPKARDAQALPVLEITIAEAMTGVARRLRLPTGAWTSVRLPAGLRNDDTVRLKGSAAGGGDLFMRARVTAEAGRAIAGDDLWLTVSVDSRILAEGGRVEVETPVGLKSVWIPRAFPQDGRLRLKSLGLPARGAAPAGDLYIRTVAVEIPQNDGARSRLKRFAQAWADSARTASGL
jgi:curved DNA-binding protein